ncbi:EAL domain-containing protein [Ferrimonas marina]|uniref:PAS domain S-box-containing protein/diguanylate cyclase (GGDEF) domain-containing protein n=1 Tax=Ferrimonas marina TaxID=299255 RepID=A0A1M5Y9Q2_9GAMM|nr:EAL domain-containing protein [Ferrimonas marina]SHI08810.1 PAS domain S-box-containing protein/diguanylate cyclase (GGDEF) domain-containing protein [Ferrimonas marina]
MRRWIATFLLFLSCVAHAGSDSLTRVYNFQQYGVTDGKALSEGTITSIARDKTGFVWIGTISGLNRFDGNEFKHYDTSKADRYNLNEDFISDLIVDKSGVLWVATKKNVYKYLQHLDSFEPILDGVQQINNAVSSANGIYVSTSNNVLFFPFDGKVQKYNIPEDKAQVDYLLLSTKKDSEVYASFFDGDAFTVDNDGNFRKIDWLPKERVTSFSSAENLGYVIGTPSGVYLANQHTKSYIRINGTPQVSSVIYSELDSSFFLASESGIFSLPIKEGYDANSLKVKKISDKPASILKVDDEGNLWAGTYGHGIARLSNKREYLQTYKVDKSSNLNNQVWAIAEHNGSIWVGNNSSIVHELSADMKLLSSLDTGINGPKSLASVDDALLVGGQGGLRSIRQGYVSDLVLDLTVTSLSKFRGQVLVGSLSEGAFGFDASSNTFLPPIIDDINEPILASQMMEKITFIATQSGLYAYKSDELGRWQRHGKLLDGTIVTTLVSIEGALVVGTVNKGLYKVDTESLETEKLLTNLSDSLSIYSAKSLDGSIYLATNNGIIVVGGSDLNLIEMFSVSDGSQKDFNGMAAGVGKGHVYFGGAEGITRVRSSNFRNKHNDLNPIITSIKVFNSEYLNDDGVPVSPSSVESITLKYSDYPFSFGFSSLNMESSETLSYEYRLSGFSEEWIPVENKFRYATFTNIPAGNYRFEVRVNSVLTSNSGSYTYLDVNITPPWWLSAFAKTLYSLLALSVVLLWYKELQRRKQVQQRIAQSEERLKLSLWGSGDEMWDWDIEAGKIYRSNMWGALDFAAGQKGQTEEQRNIHPDDVSRVNRLLMQHFKGESDHFEATYRVKGNRDNWVWILDRAKIVERDANDKPTRMTGTIKDINQIKESEERLSLFARALTNISEGMFILDENLTFIELNKACVSITGQSRESFIGNPLNFPEYPASYTHDIVSILNNQGRWSGEVDYRHSSGKIIKLELTLDRLDELDSRECFYVGVFSDITHRKVAESELRRLTNNDMLTGLPNRSYLHVSIDKLLRLEVPFCLILFDLDNFKRVNDSLGHEAGDTLLCNIANRLAARLPHEATLHRIGGDEFAVVYEGRQALSMSTNLSRALLESFEQPFTVKDQELLIDSSVGIANYPEDDQDRQALIRKAELAMYHAKSQGGQRYQFYNEGLNKAAISRMNMESLIRQALKENWFEVYYQPKVDTHSEQIIGAEALVRLVHPEKGCISPAQFIPLAEESSLIIEIGEVVLRQACFAAQTWREAGLFNGRIAVNLSSKQFMLPDLGPRIASILNVTQLPAKHLELELTEGTVIQNPDEAIQTMGELQKLGISLALDDFGTGYSSLSYLRQYPLDTLKIDKSFIDDLNRTRSGKMMVSSIVTIAKNLDLHVVAEGVEEKEQAKTLSELRCDCIQGYLYSKPLPEAEFERLLLREQGAIKPLRQKTV